MFEPTEIEELRFTVRDLRLDLQEAHLAMQCMRHHISSLANDKMAIGGELREAREALDRVKALAARWDEGYNDSDFMYALRLNDALKGDDDV